MYKDDLQLVGLFCIVDNFCKSLIPIWRKRLIEDGSCQRIRTDCLSISQIITILLIFNSSGMKCFKHFYERI